MHFYIINDVYWPYCFILPFIFQANEYWEVGRRNRVYIKQDRLRATIEWERVEVAINSLFGIMLARIYWIERVKLLQSSYFLFCA